MNILFLANLAQWNNRPSDSEEYAVATADFEVLHEARTRGLRCVDLWGFLSPGRWHELQLQAWKFSEEMGKKLSSGGCEVAELSCRDLSRSVGSLLVISEVALGMLRRERVDHASHFAERHDADFHDLPIAPPDLFNAAVEWVNRIAGVPTRKLHLPEAEAARPSFFAPEKGNAMAVPASIPRQVRYVSVAEQLGINEQAGLFSGGHGGRADWALVRDGSPEEGIASISLKAMRSLPYRSDRLKLPDLELTASAARECAGALDFEAAGILADPLLDFVWKAWLAQLELGAREYQFGRLLAGGLLPRAVLMGFDIYGPGRCFVAGLGTRGVPVLSIDHVGLGIWSDHLWNSGARSHLGVWGRFDQDGRRPWRAAEARIEVVGSLRTDHAALLKRADFSAFRSVSPKRRIVFLTSEVFRGARMIGWIKPANLAQNWEELVAMIERHPDWTPVIKPHPRYDQHGLYNRIQGRIPRLAIDKRSPAEALGGADVAVLVCTPSTVVIDAIASGVPVVYLKQGLFPDMVSPIEHGGACCCATVAELEARLSQLLDDQAHRHRVMEEQRRFLREALAAAGDEARQRTLQLLSEIENSAQPGGGPGDLGRRWLLELLAVIGDTLNGQMSVVEARRRLAALRASRDGDDLRNAPELDVRMLGLRLLDLVTWGRWTKADPAVARMLVWEVNRALPRSMRAPWSSLRAHWITNTRRVKKSVGKLNSLTGLLLAVAAPAALFRRKEG